MKTALRIIGAVTLVVLLALTALFSLDVLRPLRIRWTDKLITANPKTVTDAFAIECGTYKGGSALFVAHMMDALGVSQPAAASAHNLSADPAREKLMLSFNPRGYLRRKQ